MLREISQLLFDIERKKNHNFNGIGIIMYNNFELLPITSMNNNIDKRYKLPKTNYLDILNILLELSNGNNEFHDGFHLISDKFELSHISQYFSTPIKKEVLIGDNYGSRYRTALYGSFLEGVILTAVIGVNYGPTIFKNGEKKALIKHF